MTGSHLIYIPLILMAGMVLGFAMGRHSAAREHEEAARRIEARKARAAQLRGGSEEGPEV